MMSEHSTESMPSVALDGPRSARLGEREALIEMINFVFRISRGREPTIATDWAHVYTPENLDNVTVVCDPSVGEGGKVVASAGVWANDVYGGDRGMLRVGGINCVGTMPEYRRHGLGAQVMAGAHERMRALGCHVGLLSTGIANWYRRIGWEEAGVVRSYRLNRGNIGLLAELPSGQHARFMTLGADAGASGAGDQVNTGDLARMLRLHHAQALGAGRSIGGFLHLTKARQVQNIVLAEQVNSHMPAAYLLWQGNTIVEWAGPAASVAGLVRACFERLDNTNASTSQRVGEGHPVTLRNLTLQSPGWQHPLVEMLDAQRIPFASDYLGMIYVLDPRAILDAFGLSKIAVEERDAHDGLGATFILRDGEATIELDRRQLAKLFFGPERIGDFGAGAFPLPFWQWGLEKV